jgi:hypothetical protein
MTVLVVGVGALQKQRQALGNNEHRSASQESEPGIECKQTIEPKMRVPVYEQLRYDGTDE